MVQMSIDMFFKKLGLDDLVQCICVYTVCKMFCHFKGTVVILVVWHTHTLPHVQVCHISVDNSFKHDYNFSVDLEKSVATALSRPTDK